MTLSRLKATGSGALSLRVMIEGCPVSWVSSDAMATASDAAGRRRVAGLILRGLRIREESQLVSGDLSTDSVKITVTDVGEYASSVFAPGLATETWLTADASAGATVASVLSTASFATSGSVWLNSECMSYTGKTSTTFTGLTRGRLNTLAQWHYASDGDVGRIRNPSVTSEQPALAGRRVFIYAYGAGDDPQGDGTQVWLGRVTREPSQQGAVWGFSAKSIVTLLDQKIGNDLTTLRPRGIIFSPAHPFEIRTQTRTAGGTDTDHDVRIPDAAGERFFETQQDLCDVVNTRFAGIETADGITSTLRMEPYGDSYRFVLTFDGSDTHVLREPYQVYPFETEPSFSSLVDVDGDAVASGAGAGTYYHLPVAGVAERPGSVPRGFLNSSLGGSLAPWASSDYAVTFYLDGVVTSNATAAVVELPDGRSGTSDAISVDTGANSITLSQGSLGFLSADASDDIYWTADNAPTIRLARSYNAADSDSGNTIFNLLQNLRIQAPQMLNLGAQPDIRVSDYDLVAFSLFSTSGLPAFVRSRSYVITESTTLRDIIVPELQLAGYVLSVSSAGAISCARLRYASPAEPAVFAITASNLLTDKAFPVLERAPFGKYSIVRIKDGWDALSGEYLFPDVVLRDGVAFGRDPSGREIVISPKSGATTGQIDIREAVAVASSITGIFGQPYRLLKCEVPLTAWDVTIGQVVSLDTAHLSANGARGITGATGIVMGRELEPYSARMSLTVLLAPATVAGYAPSSLVDGSTAVDQGGDVWTITCDGDEFPGSTEAEDWFSVGDPVIVVEFDSESPTTLSGNVDLVSGNTMDIAFGGTWSPTGGTGEWILKWQDSDSGTTTATMRKYAWLADSGGIVDFDPPPDAAAYRFAP